MGDEVVRVSEGTGSMGGREEHTPNFAPYPFDDGAFQHPPESLRVGRRCILTDHEVSPDAVFDQTLELWVNYVDVLVKKPQGLHSPTSQCIRESEARRKAWAQLASAEVEGRREGTADETV